MVNRKSFIKLTSLSIGSLAIPGLLSTQAVFGSQSLKLPGTTTQQNLANTALNAARAKGASYADVRIFGNSQPGMGIRVLIKGKWGFASTIETSAEAIDQCIEKAVADAMTQSSAHIAERHQYDLRISHDLWMGKCFKKS